MWVMHDKPHSQPTSESLTRQQRTLENIRTKHHNLIIELGFHTLLAKYVLDLEPEDPLANDITNNSDNPNNQYFVWRQDIKATTLTGDRLFDAGLYKFGVRITEKVATRDQDSAVQATSYYMYLMTLAADIHYDEHVALRVSHASLPEPSTQSLVNFANDAYYSTALPNLTGYYPDITDKEPQLDTWTDPTPDELILSPFDGVVPIKRTIL